MSTKYNSRRYVHNITVIYLWHRYRTIKLVDRDRPLWLSEGCLFRTVCATNNRVGKTAIAETLELRRRVRPMPLPLGVVDFGLWCSFFLEIADGRTCIARTTYSASLFDGACSIFGSEEIRKFPARKTFNRIVCLMRRATNTNYNIINNMYKCSCVCVCVASVIKLKG